MRELRSIPARGPLTPARLRPFFLMMKLEPMKALETTANMNPFKLLEYILFTEDRRR